MNQPEGKPVNVETPKSKEDKAARSGLIGAIVSVLLVPPFAYLGAGLLVWLFRGVSEGFCSLPFGILAIIMLIVSIVSSVRGLKSSRKKMATAGLILCILAILLGLGAAIFGIIDASQHLTHFI